MTMQRQPQHSSDSKSTSSGNSSKHTNNSYSLTIGSLDGSLRSSNVDLSFANIDDIRQSCEVAGKEQREVKRSKIMVAIALLIAVIAGSSSTYILVSKDEKVDFENQFVNFASQIVRVTQENTRNTFDAIESFAVTVTSFAHDTEATWPFVMVPNFAARAHRLEKLTESRSIGFAPIVSTEKEKIEYLEYVQENIIERFESDIKYMKYNISAQELKQQSLPFLFKSSLTSNLPNASPEDRPGPWLPVWQGYPLQEYTRPLINYNILNGLRINNTFQTSLATLAPVLSFAAFPSTFESIDSKEEQKEVEWSSESIVIQPIFEEVHSSGNNNADKKKVVGVVSVIIDWIFYFQNLLPDDVNGIIVVLQSSCFFDYAGEQIGSDSITYRIDGLNAKFLGQGDRHDTAYDDMEIAASFVNLKYDEDRIPDGACIPDLNIRLYPSKELQNSFTTNNAIKYSITIVAIFLFTSIVFIFFDMSVTKRQNKIMARVIRQDQIVSNIFPSEFRDRLYGDNKQFDGSDIDGNENGAENRKMLSNLFGQDEIFGQAPMAELYTNVSVVFADITGFTAWGSTREPAQVFQLLESIYNSFDKTAYRTGVFKIETVGDCYVACAGLPEPREDHVVAVAKFARDILHDMTGLTHKLEVKLGPDTTDLKLRIGIHSGQVTAGVLRGDKSRFQLFGDTVNTASRMESTSKLNHIQLSATSADLIREFGYGKWIKQREDLVSVKGKGEMQTHWLESKSESRAKKRALFARKDNKFRSESHTGEASAAMVESNGEDEKEFSKDFSMDGDTDDIMDDEEECFESMMTKTERLVDWNVGVLSELMKQILAARSNTSDFDAWSRSLKLSTKLSTSNLTKLENEIGKEGTVLEQFKEIISLPQIDVKDLKKRRDPNSIKLDDVVVSQLRQFLTKIASFYRDNPFHNFEHASHVTASVRKLLTRIVKIDNTDDLVGHSYGITTDPLTQFAVVFSAFIHDVDHPGVPNAQLVNEKTKDAIYYKEKSVAEQKSVDLAWDILMKKEYAHLRACIYSTEKELQQFRQLVVNVVMATDICDKELGALRKARWAKAFSNEGDDDTLTIEEEDTNRKGTIVIEHLIQASDVSHTMQHWHVYRTWNEKLFKEMYSAYKLGRGVGGKDPSLNWYDGEIGFFDFYIIPLAKKLHDCGVFGVSSHEYLEYAQCNREEWVRKGKDIVAEYLENYKNETQRKQTKSGRSASIRHLFSTDSPVDKKKKKRRRILWSRRGNERGIRRES